MKKSGAGKLLALPQSTLGASTLYILGEGVGEGLVSSEEPQVMSGILRCRAYYIG